MEKTYFKRTRIPVKLEDCKIVNSIVNIHIDSKYRTSYINQTLIELMNAQIDDKFVKVQINPSEIRNQMPQFMYVNEMYKLRFINNVISINCKRKYVGWKKYITYVNLLLETLIRIDKDMSFPFIEVNYMSAYEDLEIFTKLDGKFELDNIPPFANRSFEFPCSVHNDTLGSNEAHVHCKVVDRTLLDKAKQLSTVSVFVNHLKENRTKDATIRDLEILHSIEKQVFFNLISEEFIDEQKPTYE